MKCKNCGNNIEENQKFCTNCGAKVDIIDETDRNNSTQEIKNKQLILKIFVGLFILFIIGLITYFYNKTMPLRVSTECANNTVCEISTDYNKTKKEMIVTITEPNNIMESWQQELSEKESMTTQLILPKTDLAEYLQYDSYEHRISSSQSLSVEFRLNGVELEDYVRLKKHIRVNADTKSIKLIVPDLVSTDKQITEKLKKAYLKQKELDRIAEEKKKEEEERLKAIQEYAENMTYWYDSAGNAQPFKNTDFKKCLFKVNGVCFGQPFYAKGMSYMECKAEKDKLGIKECYNSNDIWATTVKVCGGVKNLPTPEDLRLLANDLYQTNLSNADELTAHYWEGQLYRFNIAEGLQRNNSKSYLDYIRNTWWNTDTYNSAQEEKFRKELSFIIYSNQESDYQTIMVRRFGNNYTDYGSKSRMDKDTDYPQRQLSTTFFGYAITGWSSSLPISICKAK